MYNTWVDNNSQPPTGDTTTGSPAASHSLSLLSYPGLKLRRPRVIFIDKVPQICPWTIKKNKKPQRHDSQLPG